MDKEIEIKLKALGYNEAYIKKDICGNFIYKYTNHEKVLSIRRGLIYKDYVVRTSDMTDETYTQLRHELNKDVDSLVDLMIELSINELTKNNDKNYKNGKKVLK